MLKKELYNLLIIDSVGIYGWGIAAIAERIGLFESIEQTASLADAVALTQANRSFDMVISSDVSNDLVKLIYALREDTPSLRCLVIFRSPHLDPETQFPNQLFNGVIQADAESEEWEEAFHRIIKQNSYCNKGFEAWRLRLLANPAQHTHKDDLPTRRELEVLQAMAEGHSSVTIAERMGISENTVETFRKRLMSKFDAKNSVDMIVKSIKRGWIRV